MEVVIVRLGGEEQNEKGLMDLLYGVFSGDQKKVLSYIPDSDSQIRQKEVFRYVEYDFLCRRER